MTSGVFKCPTDDIIVQEGTFGFSFIASGAISGGALVKPNGTMQVVKTSNSQNNAIGVAAYSVSKDEVVTVYGPGNIIRSYCASATASGDDLFAGAGGAFHNGGAVEVIGELSPVVGIALEPCNADTHIRILLK
jgi:hypothetical protein